MNILNKIPDELKRSAVSLEDMGISGYAWTLEDTFQILDVLEKEYPEQIVLGGDLLIKRSDKIDYIYAMWSYDPMGDDKTNAKSIENAQGYLEQFHTHKDAQNLLVDLVISTKEEMAEATEVFKNRP